MHKKILLLILAICTAFLIPSTLHADDRVPVFVHGVEWSSGGTGSKFLSDRFDQGVAKRLQLSKVVRALGSNDIDLNQSVERKKGSALLKGLVAGKALFFDKKLDQASKTLKTAMQEFEAEPGADDTFGDYLEALAYLGASYVALGYGGDAKDAFRQLATLTGKRTLDDFPDWVGRFDDGVIKKYDKTARKWLKKKAGNLEIKSSESVRVSIDSDELRSPEQVAQVKLTRGRHRIGCHYGATKTTQYGWAKVKSRKTIDFDCAKLLVDAGVTKPQIDVAGFVKNVKHFPNDQKTVEDGRKIATHLGVKFIVIPFLRASGEKMEIIGSMFSADSGITVRIGSFSFGRDIASALAQAEIFSQSVEGSVKRLPYQNALVAGFLSKPSSRLTGNGLGAAAMGHDAKPTSRTRSRWYKTWWFWTASAVVVGGLSSAGYFLLEEDDESGKFELEVTW